jgi:hypothetical protein
MKARVALGPRKSLQVIDIRSPLRLTYHFPCILSKARPNAVSVHLWSCSGSRFSAIKAVASIAAATRLKGLLTSVSQRSMLLGRCLHLHLLRRKLTGVLTLVISSFGSAIAAESLPAVLRQSR